MFSKRLLSLLPGARAAIAASVALRWLALLCQVAVFLWVGRLIGGLDAPIWVAIAALAGVLAFQAAAMWFSARAGSEASNALSQKIFAQVVALGPARSRILDDAAVTQLMGEGVEMLRPYFARYVPQFFYAVIAPVTLFAVALTLNVPTAICLLVCVPLMPGSIMMLMTRAKKYLGSYWGTYVDLGGAFLDAVRGLTTLKVFGAEEATHERLDAQAEDFRQITMRLLRLQLNSVTFMDLFTYGGIAVGLIVALVQVGAGSLSLSDALVLTLMAGSFFLPMRTFGSYFHVGMNANPVIDQVLSLLDEPIPAAGALEVEGSQIAIEAEGLGFSYNGEAQALEGVDLTIRPNSFIGIAGPSGSGKSTLASVLAGWARGYSGSVRINGLEMSEIDPRSMYETVTVVSRASHVFRGSFRSNLQLALPKASDAQLWDALRRARLADFVLESGGLDAPVDADGANLSGGQAQRLCFARALLRNTPVYVFDEATSNIDAESERYLLAAIQKIALSKTVIVISHRLQVLRYADEILVMDVGCIVQRGDHETLVREDGAYRSMWLQTYELETFAQQVASELPDEGPDPVEEAFASMPGMMAGVMRAFTSILEAERYGSASAGEVPQGHPAWIPLPDYRRGISEEPAEGDDASEQGDVMAEAFGSAAGMPSFMTGLADATAEGDESAAIKEAMVRLKGHLAKPRKVRVAVTPLPRRKRGALAIIGKCVALTSAMVPKLLLATLLGALGWVSAVGVVACATCGIVAAAGGFGVLPTGVWIALAVVCALVRGPLHYGERLLTHDSTFETLALIRSRVFGKMCELAPAKIEGRDAGDLISLLTSDIEILEGFYSRACAPALAALVAAAACVAVAAAFDGALAVLFAASFIIVGLGVPALSTRLTRDRAAELRAYAVLMTGFLLDSLRGMRDLLCFGRAGEYAEELEGHLDSLAGGERGHARLVAVLDALPTAVSATCTVLAALVAAGEASCGALAPAGALILVAAFAAAMDIALSMAGLGLSFRSVLAAADRVLDVLEEEPATSEVADGVCLESFEGLSYEGVSFGYDGVNMVVEDASLSVEPGTFVGIAGKSGAGKTTLLKLAMRFWDTTEGAVRINGVDVREVDTANLRSLISYMTQETYLFAGTLRDNIKIARSDATEEQVEAAIEQAALAPLVERLPEGLDTLVGETGAGLSDGERQRVGLARVFLHDAPLLLLDEPTSNLDALNEAAILRSLCLGAEGKTVVIVSHRRAVAAIVDKLLVVEAPEE